MNKFINSVSAGSVMERGKDGNTYFRIPPRKSQILLLIVFGVAYFASYYSRLNYSSINSSISVMLVPFLIPLSFLIIIVYILWFSGKRLFAITPSGEVHIGGKRAKKLEINTYQYIPGRGNSCVWIKFAKSNIKNKYAVLSIEEQKAAKRRSFIRNQVQFITNYYATNTKTLVCIEFKEPLKMVASFYMGGASPPTLEKMYVTVKEPQKLMNYLG